MAGHSRSKNGVAEFTLGLAKGKTRGLASVPAIRVFSAARSKKDVDARMRGHDGVSLTGPHGTARQRRRLALPHVHPRSLGGAAPRHADEAAIRGGGVSA